MHHEAPSAFQFGDSYPRGMVRFVELPNSAIDAIIPNDAAREFLPKEYWGLLDPDVIRKWVTFTIPLRSEVPSRKVVSIPEECRTVCPAMLASPIYYGPGEIPGIYIVSKAGHVAGRWYDDFHNGNDHRYDKENAIGFQRYEYQMDDMDMTNRLIDNGFPATLSLATVILNDVNVERIAKHQWTILGDDLVYQIQRNLGRVVKNGSLPAQNIRIMSNRTRMGSFVRSYNHDIRAYAKDPMTQYGIRLGAQTMRDRFIRFPVLLDELSAHANIFANDIQQTFLDISLGQRVKRDAITRTVQGIFSVQREAFFRTLQSTQGDVIGPAEYLLWLGDAVTSGKDVNMAFGWCDLFNRGRTRKVPFDSEIAIKRWGGAEKVWDDSIEKIQNLYLQTFQSAGFVSG